MFCIERHIFASEENELMQVKVKNSCELKRYVCQNISSDSWNSFVNKVVLCKLYSFSIARLLLTFILWTGSRQILQSRDSWNPPDRA